MSLENAEQLLKVLVADTRCNVNAQIIDGWKRRKNEHLNPLNRYGCKCFSQTDEDGLTLEIIRRLGLEKGTFAELGVGNGSENNTLILLASGWNGFWLGGEKLVIDVQSSSRLTFRREWIALDNLCELFQGGLEAAAIDKVNVLSLDLDGNDLYLAACLLENFDHPDLFIVEYNAKFPPPIEFSIVYDQNFRWQGDDYFGASLASFAKVFEKHGYFLACCNAATGSNAFFIKNAYRGLFQDVPKDIRDIYAPPHHALPCTYGHNESLETINQIIR